MQHLLLLTFFVLVSAAHAAGFVYDGLPVERAGTLFVTHSKGKPCILLGHDRNVNKYMPSSGGVEHAKGDADFYDTLRRETLEETGGCIDHNVARLRRGQLPLIFSRRHNILLGVMNDNSITTARLNASVAAAIADPTKPGDWKEVDHFCAFSLDNFLPIAKRIYDFYQTGGRRTDIRFGPRSAQFNDITGYRGAVPGGGIVIKVKDEDGVIRELDSYYMSAMAEVYPRLKQIAALLLPPPPTPVIRNPVPTPLPGIVTPPTIVQKNKAVTLQKKVVKSNKKKAASKKSLAKPKTKIAKKKNIAKPKKKILKKQKLRKSKKPHK